MSEFIGPALPPNLRPTNSDSDSEEEEILSDKSDEINYSLGPKLPPDIEKGYEIQNDSIGPQLPPSSSDFPSNSEAVVINKTSEKLDLYGPSLPPDLSIHTDHKKCTHTVGPQLPPGIQLPNEGSEEEITDDDQDFIGPSLPNSAQSTKPNHQDEFERRSQKMKDKLMGKTDKSVQRESWMTELPEERAKVFGPGARTFMKRAPDMEIKDTSDWTDTPADRERKLKNKDSKKGTSSSKKSSHHKQDEKIANYVSDYNKKTRSESLVDLHKKKKRKAEAADNTPKQRKPFDREKDLQVNRFDEAQKKKLMKKAHELNSRFSHSTVSSSFL